MNKRTLIIIATIIILFGAGAFVLAGRGNTDTDTASTSSGNSTDQNNGQDQNPAGSQLAENDPGQSSSDTASDSSCPEVDNPVITYENDEFSPACVTVASGASISWVNKSSSEVQVGIDPHPSHTGNREVSNGDFVLNLKSGGQAKSTIATAGEHPYHDHLNPRATGMVVVK